MESEKAERTAGIEREIPELGILGGWREVFWEDELDAESQQHEQQPLEVGALFEERR